jgi:hypothetical protein
MRATFDLSARQARWITLAAQGLGANRPGSGQPIGAARFTRQMASLSALQLDAVNVLARTQFLVPFSRFGAYDPSLVHGLTGPGRPWFEYWGHAASIQPVELYPLLRPRMALSLDDMIGSATWRAHRNAWRTAHAPYIATVLREVTERGPLAASQLADPRRREGEWWDRRSDGRRALELLFDDGHLAAWRTTGFERIYDLTERVIPADALKAAVHEPAEAQRRLLVHAARSLGVGTANDLLDYFMLKPEPGKRRIAELVEEGHLVPVDVEGWSHPGYTLPGVKARRPRRQHATLLSPFDSLIWRRERPERLFDFRYRIEIYVPQAKRVHGYYVLPLLLGDQLVARFDLKADRAGRRLLVQGAFAEPHVDPVHIAGPAAAELQALANWLELERGLLIVGRGDLAAPLRQAAGSSAPAQAERPD